MDPQFLKFYRLSEAAVRLKPDEFLLDRATVEITVKGVKGLASCVREFGIKALQATGHQSVDVRDMPFALASANIINGSLADDLEDLLRLADGADSVDPMVLYSNLVRVMEVFEEAYVKIEAVLK